MPGLLVPLGQLFFGLRLLLGLLHLLQRVLELLLGLFVVIGVEWRRMRARLDRRGRNGGDEHTQREDDRHRRRL